MNLRYFETLKTGNRIVSTRFHNIQYLYAYIFGDPGPQSVMGDFVKSTTLSDCLEQAMEIKRGVINIRDLEHNSLERERGQREKERERDSVMYMSTCENHMLSSTTDPIHTQ